VSRPHSRYLGAALGLTVALTILMEWLLKLDWLLSWLIAINLVTGAAYLYDKVAAGSDRGRVPERALLFLALAGGTPIAFVTMRLIRHKTAKQSFQLRFWLIVLGQAVLLAGYYFLVTPRLDS
jgi:uncharacterized membrane protein YsdA (DUF1294 family)